MLASGAISFCWNLPFSGRVSAARRVVRYLLFSHDRFVAMYTGQRPKGDFNLNSTRFVNTDGVFLRTPSRVAIAVYECPSSKHRNNRGKPETLWTISFGTIVCSYFEPPTVENMFCIVFVRKKPRVNICYEIWRFAGETKRWVIFETVIGFRKTNRNVWCFTIEMLNSCFEWKRVYRVVWPKNALTACPSVGKSNTRFDDSEM